MFLEKLVPPQIVKEFLAFFGNRIYYLFCNSPSLILTTQPYQSTPCAPVYIYDTIKELCIKLVIKTNLLFTLYTFCQCFRFSNSSLLDLSDLGLCCFEFV
jgi:hypothetical protein